MTDINPSDVERTDGRPSDAPPAEKGDTGRPEEVRDTGDAAPDAPTVAPEEKGEEPATEHAPGSDL